VVGLDEVNCVAEVIPDVNISEENIEDFILLLCLFEERKLEEEEREGEEEFVEFCIVVLIFLFFTMIQVKLFFHVFFVDFLDKIMT
jgi:hypothetical protein